MTEAAQFDPDGLENSFHTWWMRHKSNTQAGDACKQVNRLHFQTLKQYARLPSGANP